jgi:hypothetical protein
MPELADGADVGYAVAWTKRKTLTCNWSSWLSECWARAVRFAAVASASEAMVQEPQRRVILKVDADELTKSVS